MTMSIPNNVPWEIIIVDNNSQDKTREVVENFRKSSGLNIMYVFEEKQGLSHARNRGIKEAKGGVIAFIDDDVIVDRDWLVNLHKGFEIYNPAVLGGKAIIRNESPVPKWFSKALSDPLGRFDKGDNIIIADNQYIHQIGTGANMSFKRDIFDKVGLFKTDLGRKGNKLYMGEETVTAYPHHQYLHTVGALRCCDQGGCWKSRVVALGDGDPKYQELCVDVVGDLPRCMHMITAQDVIRAVERYYEGGALPPL